MNTLAQIAASYGMRYGDLGSIVGIAGVDPNAELNDRQMALIVELIETSESVTGSRGRHGF